MQYVLQHVAIVAKKYPDRNNYKWDKADRTTVGIFKKLRSDITGIEYVSEEDLNRMLLGTGMELYNPSSGVEVFGLEYNKKVDLIILQLPIPTKNDISDVRKFRNKEKEMRIEDLTEYAYTVSEQTLNNSGENQ